MTQTPNSTKSPFGSKLWALEFPQSLGTFPEYTQVQKMVDTLADHNFPVEHTLIVGTDLKLMERVTGRKSWPRILLSGVLSGAWLGLFVGLLIGLFSDNWLQVLVQSILMGMVFFTIWAAVGHAASRGERDFTSMATTVPMQYELLVEHRLLTQAQQILSQNGLPLGPGAWGTAPAPTSMPTPPTNNPAPNDESDASRRPQYGLPGDN